MPRSVKYGLTISPTSSYWLEAHWSEIFAGGRRAQRGDCVSCQARPGHRRGANDWKMRPCPAEPWHTFATALEAAKHLMTARVCHAKVRDQGGLGPGHRSRTAPTGTNRKATPHGVEGPICTGGACPTHLGDVPGGCLPPTCLMDLSPSDKKVSRAGALTSS